MDTFLNLEFVQLIYIVVIVRKVSRISDEGHDRDKSLRCLMLSSSTEWKWFQYCESLEKYW